MTGQIPRDHSLGPTAERLQELGEQGVRASVPPWVRTGKMLTGLSIEASSSRSIRVGIGRPLQGWAVLNQRGSGYTPYASSSQGDVLVLNNADATNKVQFDLWVW